MLDYLIFSKPSCSKVYRRGLDYPRFNKSCEETRKQFSHKEGHHNLNDTSKLARLPANEDYKQEINKQLRNLSANIHKKLK